MAIPGAIILILAISFTTRHPAFAATSTVFHLFMKKTIQEMATSSNVAMARTANREENVELAAIMVESQGHSIRIK